MRFRNEFPAFEGECEASANGSVLSIKRTNDNYMAELVADMQSYTCSITYSGPDGKKQKLDL
jgi:hypothetical protein